MILISLLLMAAQSAAPTPTPTPAPAGAPPAIKILLGQQSSESSARRSSLEDVAKRIKLRLPAGGTSHTITNQTVVELSAGVELTTAEPSSGQSALGSEAGGSPESAKAFWQKRYQDARATLAYWKKEAARLDGEVNRLERQFYAEDDPAYRDGVIKPAWDKALVEWRHAKEETEKAAGLPGEVLNEARKSGALPGWFRGLPEPEPKLPAQNLPNQPPLPEGAKK